MGASIQWRRPPADLENRHYGSLVSFGRGRSAGRGYMAASSRVGPSVLVVGDDSRQATERAFADSLNRAGFTALAVEVPDDRDPRPVLEAAAEFLSENWHPRLGVIAFDSRTQIAVETAEQTRAEAFVAFAEQNRSGSWPRSIPTMVHMLGARTDDLVTDDSGDNVEMYTYNSGEEPADDVFARTLDFLTYHLS